MHLSYGMHFCHLLDHIDDHHQCIGYPVCIKGYKMLSNLLKKKWKIKLIAHSTRMYQQCDTETLQTLVAMNNIVRALDLNTHTTL